MSESRALCAHSLLEQENLFAIPPPIAETNHQTQCNAQDGGEHDQVRIFRDVRIQGKRKTDDE